MWESQEAKADLGSSVVSCVYLAFNISKKEYGNSLNLTEVLYLLHKAVSLNITLLTNQITYK